MRLLRLLSVPALVCAAALTASAQSPASEPLVVLRTGIEEVLAIAYAPGTAAQPLSERVRATLQRDFNFESITRRAVGPGWKKFTPEQQTKAVELFTTQILRTYADRFEVGDRPGITYNPAVTLAPGKIEVPTTIDYAGKKYAVTYRMEQAKTGAWRVYDVVIEGVSMIANYRAQFDALFQKGGAEAILKSLEPASTAPVVPVSAVTPPEPSAPASK